MNNDILERLQQSPFRRQFKLSAADKAYAEQKGLNIIRQHAEDFIRTRLAPAVIPNDGRQTPMRNHPVFTAQHATATCCRGCFAKWHHVPAGTELTEAPQKYAVELIITWIERQIKY